MATTVKVMLNDKSAIEELAKDPEVQLKIKNAIVDDVAKRAAKAVEASLKTTISSAVTSAMERFMKGETPNDIVKSFEWGRVVLSDKIKKKIQEEVGDKLTLAAFDYTEKFPENAELREALKRQVAYVNSLDVEGMLSKAIEKIVRAKFGGSR